MNGRTCQLCGKPLSRIWAGGGGDFCSREHRNQYRLRCGMDTLLEANKHASLMRRRDHLRQFSSTQLQRNSAIAPHHFESFSAAIQRPLLCHVPIASALPAPRIDPGEGHFMDPSPSGGLRGASAFSSRPAARAAFASSRRPASQPFRVHRLSTSLGAADTVPIRLQSSPRPVTLRSFSLLAAAARRALLVFRPLEGEPLGSLSGKRARRLELSPKVGNAFRVSGNSGFRLPGLSKRPSSLPAPVAQGMSWPESKTVPHSPRHGRVIPLFETAIDFRVAAVRKPSSGKSAGAVALPRATAVEIVAQSPYELRLDARQSDWAYQSLQGRLVLSDAGLHGGPGRLGPDCVPLKPVLAGAAASKRLESAPFQPGEQALINISYSWNASK